jgi:hypothetical protein
MQCCPPKMPNMGSHSVPKSTAPVVVLLLGVCYAGCKVLRKVGTGAKKREVSLTERAAVQARQQRTGATGDAVMLADATVIVRGEDGVRARSAAAMA